MTSWKGELNTTLTVVVHVVADDEDEAYEQIHEVAETFADTLMPGGDERLISVEASFDGSDVEEFGEVGDVGRDRSVVYRTGGIE